MTVVTYDDWNAKDKLNSPELVEFVNNTKFKGFMNGPVAVDADGNKIAAKSRSAHTLEEITKFNFEDCVLYTVNRVNYFDYKLPEGKQPYDYDFVELEKFEKEPRHGYIIRYAGEEKR